MKSKNPKIYLISIIITALSLSLINQPIAKAHAELIESKTSYNKDSSIEVILNFNEEIEVDDILLINSNLRKERISFKKIANTISIRSSKLPKGRYVLRYRVVSQDGHLVIGAIGLPNQVKDKEPKSQNLKALTLDNKESLPIAISTTHPGYTTIKSKDHSFIRAIKMTHVKSKITLQTSKKQEYFESYLPLSGAWSMEVSYKKDKFTETQYFARFEIKP